MDHVLVLCRSGSLRISTYNIVKLIVSVHNGISVPRQIAHHKVNNLVIVFMGTAEKRSCFDVSDNGLLLFDSGKRSAMPLIEAYFLPKSLETNRIWIN